MMHKPTSILLALSIGSMLLCHTNGMDVQDMLNPEGKPSMLDSRKLPPPFIEHPPILLSQTNLPQIADIRHDGGGPMRIDKTRTEQYPGNQIIERSKRMKEKSAQEGQEQSTFQNVQGLVVNGQSYDLSVKRCHRKRAAFAHDEKNYDIIEARMKRLSPEQQQQLKKVMLWRITSHKTPKSHKRCALFELPDGFKRLQNYHSKTIIFDRARIYPNMIAKVIAAVDSLNSIGIAYKNIKPENIYVTSYTAKQMAEIKLVGFEAAFAIDGTGSGHSPAYSQDAKAVGNLITTIFYDENKNARLGFEDVGRYYKKSFPRYREQRKALLKMANRIEAGELRTIADVMRSDEYRLIVQPIPFQK